MRHSRASRRHSAHLRRRPDHCALCCTRPADAEPKRPEQAPGSWNQPKRWDGKTISFTGEAITQAMKRGDYSWIHLNDDPYYLKNVEEGATLGGYNSGMAVCTPTRLADKIVLDGDYTHEGDVVHHQRRVQRGVLPARRRHGHPRSDVFAWSRLGHEFREPVKLEKLAIAVVLLALAAAALVLLPSGSPRRHVRTLFPAAPERLAAVARAETPRCRRLGGWDTLLRHAGVVQCRASASQAESCRFESGHPLQMTPSRPSFGWPLRDFLAGICKSVANRCSYTAPLSRARRWERGSREDATACRSQGCGRPCAVCDAGRRA